MNEFDEFANMMRQMLEIGKQREKDRRIAEHNAMEAMLKIALDLPRPFRAKKDLLDTIAKEVFFEIGTIRHGLQSSDPEVRAYTKLLLDKIAKMAQGLPYAED